MNTTTGAVPADYRNFHLWMLLPFAISILGFSYSYYLNLANATFHQHVPALNTRTLTGVATAAAKPT